MAAKKNSKKATTGPKRARKQIVLSITDDYPYLKRDLDKLSKEDNRSLSSYACLVLAQHIERVMKNK